jgi:hypothetical protein
MSPWYGFELQDGRTVQVEAGNVHEAMESVEKESGSTVQRGRCLDGFDNLAPEGRAELVRPY